MEDYQDFITGTHSLYDRYYNDWRLCVNSWYGGVEYKDAKYLRAYQVDLNTPSETITTYSTADDGSVISKHRAKLEYGHSGNEVDRGQDMLSGSFYLEKLDNTPLYNYVKLIVSEYNSMLFRNPPVRQMPQSAELDAFLSDVDGEGNSINEFMSQLDCLSTVYGVIHVGCYKTVGSDIPKFKIHSPTDVTNWRYTYDADGNLKLSKIVIQLESSSYHSVYRYITESEIWTVFCGEEDDYYPPVTEGIEEIGENMYAVKQENELGYIPIITVYQNTKIYNNVGSTIIQDVAQIQRSIYGDSAEIYSAITYGSHPTLLVDNQTDALNDGQIGAEPGAVIRVENSLTGTPSYVYEFASPDLSSIEQIQKLIDSKIEKLTQIAMLRSEDLIRASRSGAQIETYDDKLSAQIRKKATNLENAEYNLWQIWADWLNQDLSDITISYNRQFNKRALELELGELEHTMRVLERYEQFATTEIYPTPAQAEARATELGGSGFHEHTTESGETVYMPFETHADMESALGDDDRQFKTEIRAKIRQRLSELLTSSATHNSF